MRKSDRQDRWNTLISLYLELFEEGKEEGTGRSVRA